MDPFDGNDKDLEKRSRSVARSIGIDPKKPDNGHVIILVSGEALAKRIGDAAVKAARGEARVEMILCDDLLANGSVMVRTLDGPRHDMVELDGITDFKTANRYEENIKMMGRSMGEKHYARMVELVSKCGADSTDPAYFARAETPEEKKCRHGRERSRQVISSKKQKRLPSWQRRGR